MVIILHRHPINYLLLLFDHLGQDSKFSIVFTEQSLYSSIIQATDIPYEFTIANITKTGHTGVHFYDITFKPPSPTPYSFIFNYTQVLANGTPSTGVNGNPGENLFSGSYGPDVDIKILVPTYTLNKDGVVQILTNQSATRLLEEANPLGNSVNVNRASYTYQNVDFGAGIVTASNLSLIKEGNATRAQVQDSNYTKTGHVNARYNGTRASSPDFNIRSKVN